LEAVVMPASNKICVLVVDGFHPRDGHEGIIEVDSFLLDKLARHQSCLVLDKHPCFVLLELEDPLRLSSRRLFLHPTKW
jgi:hypothetical protein